MEPTENLIADKMVAIMQRHMPENGELYLESKMLWGEIWREMQTSAKGLIPSQTDAVSHTFISQSQYSGTESAQCR